MSFKLMLVCAVVAACCLVDQSVAIKLIELTDANQGILLLDLSKSLAGVQEAYKKEFNFQSVAELRKFMRDCMIVNDMMKDAADEAYEGMAKQIKAILAEPSISLACSVSSKALTQEGFDELDTDYKASEHDYLSAQKTAHLVAMKKALETTPNLQLVLGHLVNSRISELAEGSLSNAATNVDIYFGNKIKSRGVFDFNYMKYESTCKIDLIRPICKLVRRSSDEDITAISADLSEFIDLVQSGNQAKLAEFEKASGVSMVQLKAKCASMKDGAGRYLRPIDKIEQWIAEDLMTEHQFQERLSVDRDLAFYNELNKLCKLSA